MGNARISHGELRALTGKTRMQIDYCIQRFCPFVVPENVGGQYFFSPAQVTAVIQALSKVTPQKPHRRKERLAV